MSRRRNVVIGTASVLLALGALFAGSVAVLTQTDRGLAFLRSALLPTISTAIPGRLYVGAIHGSLFSDLTIDSLEIREPNGGPFLTSGRIQLTYDPRDLLDRRIVLKSVVIEHPVVTLVDYGNDDWSHRRALKKKASPLPTGAKTSFGKFVVVDTATIHEGTLVVRMPWVLSDSLKGAKRDSALYYNLHRQDQEIRREVGRYTRTFRFVRSTVALGKSRLADPDSAGQRFTLQKLDAVWMMPPFWFRNLKTDVFTVGDTMWLNNLSFNLANSGAKGVGKIIWGSHIPVRYDIKLHGDSVGLADVAWIDNSLPFTGGGSLDLTIKNDPQNLSVIEYGIRNMDARSMKSRVRGNMTFAVGGPVLRVSDVALDMIPANTDLLRQFNGEPFPFDWQGDLTAKITARGGPVNHFQIDRADFSYNDAHVPGAISSGSATGSANIFTPALTILQGIDLRIDQLDLRTPRYVNKLFPEITGVVSGTVRLDSLWYDARFSNADLTHTDGPAEPSRFTGDGRITLLTEGVKFDVDMQAAPLSYTTLARSYPGLPLRGLAVGSIKASGMAEDFNLSTTLAGEGGEIAFVGKIDAFEPEYSATGKYHARGVNLRTLLGDPAMPVTTLNLIGDASLKGATLSSLRGTLTSEMEGPTRFGDARLYAGQVQVAFDSGHMQVSKLKLESSAFAMSAAGGLGLISTRPDSMNFTLSIDSLGGLRQWFAATDTVPAFLVAIGDSLRGTLDIHGTVSGTIDTTDANGLHVHTQVRGLDLLVGAWRAARGTATLDVSDAMRTGVGTAELLLDSAHVGTVAFSSLSARANLRNGLAERFAVNLRSAADATVALTGAISRSDTFGQAELVDKNTFVLIDTLNVRVDTTRAGRGRGFTLATPAHFVWGANGSGSLDSLVLAHTDTGEISFRGALTATGAVSGLVRFDRAPLADFGLLFQSPSLQSGRLDLNAILSGTKERPSFTSALAVRDATFGSMHVGLFDARANYDSTNLAFDGTLWAGGRRALVATAALPLDLAWSPLGERKLDRPLVGRMRTDSVDLSTLRSLFPDVSAATGSLNADVALTGSWEHPRLRGLVKLDDGTLALSNLGVRFDRVHADLALAGDTLLVRQLAATSGLPGDSVSVAGHVIFSDLSTPQFDLQLAARNFLAIDKPRSASLTISTTRPVQLTGSTDAALIRGGVRVDRGRVYVRALTQKRAIDLTDDLDVIDTTVVRMNALLPNAPSAIVQNLTLDNVLIDIGDDVWLRSPEANIKLGGALRVTRSVGRDGAVPRLALSDSLTVQRGTYQLNLGLARPSFEVERGVIRFFGDPDLEPGLDISALHTVREVRANSNRQDVRIRVNIGGTLNRLSLALSSADNPPLPESDMLSYLVTGEPANLLLGASYSEQGATLALRFAGSFLSSRLAGGRFDVVQVEPTAIAPGEAANLQKNGLGILAATRVALGMQVGSRTYVSLSTGFCGLTTQNTGGADLLSNFAQGLGVKAERRLNGGLSLALGLEPGSSAQSCGRLGLSRTFQQTPQQFGADLFKSWAW